MLARVEAGEGRRLAGVVESGRTAIERQEDRDGLIPQAGDRIEQATLGFEVGIVVDPLADSRLDLGNDAIQMRDQGLDAWTHAGVGHRQPVLLLGTHDHQCVTAGDQGAQFALSGRRRPKEWALAGAKVGDQAAILILAMIH